GRVAVPRVRGRVGPQDPRGEDGSPLRSGVDREVVCQRAEEAPAVAVDDPFDPEGKYVSAKVVLNAEGVFVEDRWAHGGRGVERSLLACRQLVGGRFHRQSPLPAAPGSLAAARRRSISLMGNRG